MGPVSTDTMPRPEWYAKPDFAMAFRIPLPGLALAFWLAGAKSGFFHGKQPPVLADGVTIRHPCNVVGNRPRQVGLCADLKLGRQQACIAEESPEQVGDYASGLVAHARNPVMLIQMRVQEFLEFLLFLLDTSTESDQGRRMPHLVDPARLLLRDQ